MPLPVLFLLLFFGLSLGSFLNVVGRRIPINQSFLISRSACPQCHHLLSWYELIPVFSYMLQKGKCKNCHQKISPLYPVIEVLAGFMILWCGFKVGISSEFVIALVYISFCLSLFVAIVTSEIIPQNLLAFYLILSAFLILAYSQGNGNQTLFIVGFSLLYYLIMSHLKKGIFVISLGQILIINYFILGITNLLMALFISCLLTLLMYFTATRHHHHHSKVFQNTFIMIFIFVTLVVYLISIAQV